MESSSNTPLLKKIILEIWDIIKFLAPIVVIVFFVRTYIAQPFIVDGESSSPNFHTGHYLIIDELTYRFREPARGDVIVLRYPLQPSRFFLKRIVGLPGERVVIKDGKVYIYNTENPKGYVLDEPYQKQATFPAGPYRDVTLAPEQYFVMGDNRSGSDDSRMWGILPRNDIMGHVLLRLFPIKLAAVTPASVDDFK
ncbi:MAG: signal peptidase I [bacterium]